MVKRMTIIDSQLWFASLLMSFWILHSQKYQSITLHFNVVIVKHMLKKGLRLTES